MEDNNKLEFYYTKGKLMASYTLIMIAMVGIGMLIAINLINVTDKTVQIIIFIVLVGLAALFIFDKYQAYKENEIFMTVNKSGFNCEQYTGRITWNRIMGFSMQFHNKINSLAIETTDIDGTEIGPDGKHYYYVPLTNCKGNDQEIVASLVKYKANRKQIKLK